MARLDWAHLCETAFLDSCGRLCMIGVTARFPVPSVPVAVHQLMLAARIVDVRPGDQFEVTVTVYTPSGLVQKSEDKNSVDVEIAGEYVIVMLRNLLLVEEGIYRFGVAIGDETPLTVDIPVFQVSSRAGSRVH